MGCEAAGEIATEFPSKRITLVHAGERLLTGRVKPELSERVLRLLREKRVNVLLGQRATVGAVPFGGAAFVDEATTVRTSGSDEELPADMVILATGGKVNSACYQVDFGAQMDELERLKVQPARCFPPAAVARGAHPRTHANARVARCLAGE